MRSFTAIAFAAILSWGSACQSKSNRAGAATYDGPVSDTAIVSLSGSSFFELTQEHPNMLVIDVRSKDEFKTGHIDRAANWNFESGELAGRMQGIDRAMPVALYCSWGKQSGPAAAQLQAMGFQKIYVLGGGLAKYGRPVTSGQ